jgi:hypothetical protein
MHGDFLALTDFWQCGRPWRLTPMWLAPPERTHLAWLSDPARNQTYSQDNYPSGQRASCLEKPTGIFAASHSDPGIAKSIAYTT